MATTTTATGSGTSPTTSSFWKDLWIVITDPLNEAYRKVTILLVCTLLLIPLCWAAEMAGYGWVGGIVYFVGIVVILIFGFAPEMILGFLGLGAFAHLLLDIDKSQGAARGVKVQYRTVMWAAWGFAVPIGLLALLPWEGTGGLFWAFLIPVVALVLIMEAKGIPSGYWAFGLTAIFTVGTCIYVAWSFVPETWRGNYFDARNGQSIYMMEPDGSAIYTQFAFEDCTGTEIVSLGRGGSSVAERSCYSPKTGLKLVPVTPEAAEQHDLFRNGRELLENISFGRTPASVEPEWSPHIAVAAGRNSFSDRISAPTRPDSCFKIQIVAGAPNTPAWIFGHSEIVPTTSMDEDGWKPNDGSKFSYYRIGKSDKPFVFKYRFAEGAC